MSHTPENSDQNDGWAFAFAFWGTLLVAGALFAAVALAPKLRTLAELDAVYAENQFRLVELERQADELARVTESLEHDPAFTAELAKLEFSAGRAGDERISMPHALQLGAGVEDSSGALSLPSPRTTPPAVPRWLLDALATHRGLRLTLLAAAAALALFALLALHESQITTVRNAVVRLARLAGAATDRYRRMS